MFKKFIIFLFFISFIHAEEKPFRQKTFNVLTFDGGGVRGVFTAQIVAMLEEELHFLKNVDFFVGTSTGSILACGLAYGVAPLEIVHFYQAKAKEIFKEKNQKFKIKKEVSELLKMRPRYKMQNLKEALKEVFPEDLMLKGLSKKVLCVSFDLNLDNNWSVALIDNFEGNVSVLDAILRSSAAPTYFSSYQGHVDGGVIANNPSMMALTRSLDKNGASQDISNIRLLSLGTGRKSSYISHDVDWGLFDWAIHPSLDADTPITPLLDIILDGTVIVPHFQCSKILSSKYFRLNPLLSSSVSLDDWTRVDEMIAEAKRLPIDSPEEWENLLTWVKNNFLLEQH